MEQPYDPKKIKKMRPEMIAYVNRVLNARPAYSTTPEEVKKEEQPKVEEQPKQEALEGEVKPKPIVGNIHAVCPYKQFEDILKTVLQVQDNCNFIFRPSGLEVRVMDPIRVSMLVLTVSRDNFEEWSVSGAEEVRIGMAVDEINKFLDKIRKKSESTVVFRYGREFVPEEKGDKYTIGVRSSSYKELAFHNIDLGKEELDNPKVEFNVTAKIVTEDLKEAICIVSAVSDQCHIEASEQGSLVLSESGDSADALIEFKRGSEALLDLEMKTSEKQGAIYAINYLKDYIRMIDTEVCELSFSRNMPLRLASHGFANKIWYLAPRREVE